LIEFGCFDKLFPRLNRKKCIQQVKGGYSASLLCSGETPSGVLCPPLEPSAQDRHGPVGVGPEEGHKNNQRAGTPLVWGKAATVGIVQPEKDKALGTPYYSLSVL